MSPAPRTWTTALIVWLFAFVATVTAARIAQPSSSQHRSFPQYFYLRIHPRQTRHEHQQSYLGLRELPRSNVESAPPRAAALHTPAQDAATLFSLRDGVLRAESRGNWSAAAPATHQLVLWEPKARDDGADGDGEQRCGAFRIRGGEGANAGGQLVTSVRRQASASAAADAGVGAGVSAGAGAAGWYYCDGRGVAFRVQLRNAGVGRDECQAIDIFIVTTRATSAPRSIARPAFLPR